LVIDMKYKFNSEIFKKRNLWFCVCGVVLFAMLTVGLIFASDIYGWSGDGDKVMIEIREGSSMSQIAEILDEKDVIDFSWAFRMYVKTEETEHIIRQGGHIFDKGMSYEEIIKKLEEKPDVEFSTAVKITVPEGYENRQIADKLAEAGLVDREKFMNELEQGEFDFDFVRAITRTENRLEGYLYPATYDIYPGETEHDIICKMLKAFEKNIVPLYEGAETELSLDQVVTFASLVEREAANDGERKTVASVFFNRIEKDMTLSSCASVQYVLKEHKAVLSISDIKIESPYNTYINKGLPVGPIASPGTKSVEAVLYPEDTEFLFFVARPDGSENLFSVTGEEHEQKRRELYEN